MWTNYGVPMTSTFNDWLHGMIDEHGLVNGAPTPFSLSFHDARIYM